MANTGRKRISIDWEAFDKLCGLQCTQEEIADFFSCSVDTIERAVKRDKGKSFAEYFLQKRGLGKVALRRNQFRMAETSATMAIWLGKQYLDQKDDRSIELNGGLTISVADDYGEGEPSGD